MIQNAPTHSQVPTANNACRFEHALSRDKTSLNFKTFQDNTNYTTYRIENVADYSVEGRSPNNWTDSSILSERPTSESIP